MIDYGTKSFTDPCQEHHEGVEVEVALTVTLGVIICPDHREHRQALGQKHNRAWSERILIKLKY